MLCTRIRYRHLPYVCECLIAHIGIHWWFAHRNMSIATPLLEAQRILWTSGECVSFTHLEGRQLGLCWVYFHHTVRKHFRSEASCNLLWQSCQQRLPMVWGGGGPPCGQGPSDFQGMQYGCSRSVNSSILSADPCLIACEGT